MVRRRVPAPAPLLAIGGLDPSGHAGLLADVRVFEAGSRPYRVAVTAVTAQSEKRFYSSQPVAPRLFREQLQAAGTAIAGVKIGMLGDEAHLSEVLRWLDRARPELVVWDPVWRSSTGKVLLDIPPRHPKMKSLLRRCDVLTPNLPEAEWLLGRSLRHREEAEAAALDLWSQGEKPGRLVVLKGGHLADKSQRRKSVDWLAMDGKLFAFEAERRNGDRRGSGCTFASSLLLALASGREARAAVRQAKRSTLQLWLPAV